MLPNSNVSNSDYLWRYVDNELDELEELRAIALDGPKAVGKSETCFRRSASIFHLDWHDERSFVQAQLRELPQLPGPICLDEWQKLPEVWDVVRRSIDAKVKTRYYLTGSASPIAGVDTHSGAGRIVSLRMRPLCLAERPGTEPSVWMKDLFSGGANIQGATAWGLGDYVEAICATGLPELGNSSQRVRDRVVQSYITRAIDRDIPEQGLMVRRPEAVLGWWRAYAGASSTTMMYNKILDAATAGDPVKLSKDAALGYRDVLSKLWLLDPVPAWWPTRAPMKRLTTGPKHQVFDPGIAAALLGVTPDMLMTPGRGSWELLGQLFESLATLTVRVAGQAASANTYHLRTRAGEHEVDLIAERYDGKVVAFEVKLARDPDDRDVRHLHWLGTQIGDDLVDKVVITTGQYAYRRPDGVAVVPLALLG